MDYNILEWTSLKSNDALRDCENKVKWRETFASDYGIGGCAGLIKIKVSKNEK